MRAAVVTGPGRTPEYGSFDDPEPGEGAEVVSITASALSNVVRARAAGAHYSAGSTYPFVPGIDGAGRTEDGRRVAFLFPDAPFGGMAERAPVPAAFCVPVPDSVDDVTAAALLNPGLSPVASLRERAVLRAGETVLVLGATGITGLMAVQVAQRLGAGRVVAAGRNPAALARAEALGAAATVDISGDEDGVRRRLTEAIDDGGGVGIVLDYLSGDPAGILLDAIAAARRPASEVRYVLTGGAAGTRVAVPNRVVAAMPLTLLGNGIGSVPIPRVVASVAEVLRMAGERPFEVAVREVPLAEVEAAWSADSGGDRIVFRV